MITLLYGENDFELKKRLQKITKEFVDPAAIEKIDGDSLVPDDLADLLTGMSLFANERLVVVYGASANKNVWEKLADYVGQDSQTHLVLVEETPDKRTKTFKTLAKNTEVEEFSKIDETQAVKWLVEVAKDLGMDVSSTQARQIVDRAGTDQWKLKHALERLVHTDDVSENTINEQIEATPGANVFELVDAALQLRPDKVKQLVRIAAMSEDPYFFFGLLSSQLFQLITLAVGGKKPAEVAKDLGVHPYPLQKMNSTAQKVSRADTQKIADILAECDDKIKRSGNDPWTLIEQALLKLANR